MNSSVPNGGVALPLGCFNNENDFVHGFTSRIALISVIISAIRCSFLRISSVNCSGGKCSKSCLLLGSCGRDCSLYQNFTSGTFHACSFSSRFFHHAMQALNSSNWMGWVLVYFFRPSGNGCS